jgi:hypothetical protein
VNDYSESPDLHKAAIDKAKEVFGVKAELIYYAAAHKAAKAKDDKQAQAAGRQAGAAALMAAIDQFGDAGPMGSSPGPPPEYAPPHGEPEPPRQPPRIISPASLVGSPPPRRWTVRDWIPYEVVTALYGDGGIGKSLLLMQLQTSTALGLPWLGLPVEPVPSLGVYCEDPHDELWRRQDDIDASYGVFGERHKLGEAHWMVRFGEDNTLMTFTRGGVAELTRFHKEVVEAARDLGVRLVCFDTANDGFPGDENNRSQVRQYVQRGFGSIALAIDGAVVVSAHPSQSGLSSGEGTSGSGAWSNSFRSRLFFRLPEVERGERRDDNARVLERRKANYASARDELNLVWRCGAFEPANMPAPGATALGRIDA